MGEKGQLGVIQNHKEQKKQSILYTSAISTTSKTIIFFLHLLFTLVSLFRLCFCSPYSQKMPRDLFHPSQSEEKNKHKLHRLIQSPNSFFMDVKCPGCFHITTIFSHAHVSFLFSKPSISVSNLFLSSNNFFVERCHVPWLRTSSQHTNWR